MTTRKMLVLFGLLAAGASACGTAQPSAEPATQIDGQVSVVDELLYGYESEAAHIYAEDLTWSCMTRAGFDYEAQPYLDRSLEIAATLSSRAFREEFGYGLTIETDIFTSESVTEMGGQMASYLASLSQGEAEAYDAQLTNCMEEADSGLAAARDGYVEALPDDAQLALAAVADGSDPAMLELEEEWSACMARLGFELGGPFDVFEHLSVEFSRVSSTATTDDDEALQQLEREIAVADHDCAEDLQPRIDARLDELAGLLEAEGDGGIFD